MRKLNTIKDDISIIAENGGILEYKNEQQVLFQLSLEQIKSTIRKTKGAYSVLWGKKSA